MGKALLENANLQKIDLEGANLTEAILVHADFRGAILQEAVMFNSNFHGANLEKCNLKNSKVTLSQLAKAKSLEGATMPDGMVYNPETFRKRLEEQNE